MTTTQRETTIVVCPQCEARLMLLSAQAWIDACGFENHHCHCAECEYEFSGIIDPYDEAFLYASAA